jgi:hypothetical protein
MQTTAAETQLFHDDTYEIPIANLALLIPKLEKLNRKAARLNCEPVTYEILDRFEREVVVDDITGYKRKIQFAVVSVKGERPQLEGWTFVATLMHAGEAGTIIRAVPGFEVPVQYRDATPEWCDHCHQPRMRRDTYVVYNPEAGFRQVGKNCLQDFLGGASPQALAARFHWLLEIREAFRGATGWREQQVYYLDEYLSFVQEQIARHGWVSKKKSQETEGTQEHQPPTAFEALDMMLRWQEKRDMEAQNPGHYEWWTPSETSQQRAKAAIEASLENLEQMEEQGRELNDYQHNVLVVLKSPAFEWRAAGIAASIIPFYDRLLELQRQQAEKRPSEWQGEVGHVIYRKLLVLRKSVRYVDAAAKDADIVGFVDDDGNEYVWFASRMVDEWSEGDELFIRATVKNHLTSRIGIKQTVLTYVKQVQESEYLNATRPRPQPLPSAHTPQGTVARAIAASLPPRPAGGPNPQVAKGDDTYVALYKSLDIYDEIKGLPITQQARRLKQRGYGTSQIAKMLGKSYQQIYQAVGK